MLIFFTDLVLDIFLDSTQHERFQDRMKTLNFDLVELTLVLTVGLDIFREPFIEKFMRVEKIRHYKIEKGP